jgi:glycosyltransferase involved in cell wall biosynthesis
MKPVISVIITTYNQQKYIKDAIESVLVQKDCPEFEVIIGNDCSIDKTTDIIEEYVQKYPNLIKHIHHQKNVGMLYNMKTCFKSCCGKFVAICEGDDYWSDEYKLKKQYEALKANPKASMCFNDISLLIDKTGEFFSHIPETKKQIGKKLTISNLILMENPIGNFSCCMYRKAAIDSIPPSYYNDKDNADWLFNMYITSKGDAVYINEPCSVYRIIETSTYNRLSNNEKLIGIILMILKYNKLFDNKYINDFMELLQRKMNEVEYYLKQTNAQGEKKSKYTEKRLLRLTIPITKRKKLRLSISRLKGNKN